jgi:hypothetical protein
MESTVAQAWGCGGCALLNALRRRSTEAVTWDDTPQCAPAISCSEPYKMCGCRQIPAGMLVREEVSAFSSPLLWSTWLHQAYHFIGAHDPAHAGEDALEEELMIVPAHGVAAVGNENEPKIQVAGIVGRAGNADIGRATGEDDRIDAPDAKIEVQVGLEEGVPAMLWHDHVAGCWCQFGGDLRLGRVFVKARLYKGVAFAQRLEVHIRVRQPCHCVRAIRRMAPDRIKGGDPGLTSPRQQLCHVLENASFLEEGLLCLITRMQITMQGIEKY